MDTLKFRHDFAIVLEHELNDDHVKAIVADLESFKFNCAVKKEEEKHILFVGLNDEDRILQEAEKQMIMVYRNCLDKEKAQKKKEKLLRQKAYLDQNIINCEEKKPYCHARRNEYYEGEFNQILNEATKSRLIYIILDKVRVSDMKNTLKAFCSKQYSQLSHDRESFMYFLKRHNLIEEMTALHSKSRVVRAHKEGHKDDLKKSKLKESLLNWRVFYLDVELFRSYYGDEVAIYFDWMNFFLQTLMVPGLLSLPVYFINQFMWDIADSPLAGCFSILMALWGTWFLCWWRRRTYSLNVLWDDYVIENDAEQLRKEFKGVPAIDPVTDEETTVFPANEQYIRYLQSFAICFPCWCVACFVIVIFLNMTGVIRPEHHHGAFNIPIFSRMADEGAIFDPESNMNMVACILQTIVTILMNFKFSDIARWTAANENHKTERGYNNSVFIKRFIFEFTDFQMYLFYIGIYQANLKYLRVNLVSLFMVDEVRRVVMETIIPYLTQNKEEIKDEIKKQATKLEHKVSDKLHRRASLISNDDDLQVDPTLTEDIKGDRELANKILEEEMKELEKDEVELFDDYLEMIMTFGYITLFASAFPLGSFITCVFLYIEVRSDAYKIETNMKRPFSRTCHDIGTWELALDLLTFGSIFTNIYLAFYASDQMDLVFPWLKVLKEDSATSLITMFSIEHLLILIVLTARWFYDSNPKWVDVFFARKSHKALKRDQKLEQQVKKQQETKKD